MFIEFGRLGCKHIIYLGAGYVHLKLCVHTPAILAQALCMLVPVVRNLKTLFDRQAEVTSLARSNQPEGTGLVG